MMVVFSGTVRIGLNDVTRAQTNVSLLWCTTIFLVGGLEGYIYRYESFGSMWSDRWPIPATATEVLIQNDAYPFVEHAKEWVAYSFRFLSVGHNQGYIPGTHFDSYGLLPSLSTEKSMKKHSLSLMGIWCPR